MNTNNNKPDNEALRRALGRMLEETAPTAGWEERVMKRAPQPRRRRLWLLPGIGAAAAAIAVLLMMPGKVSEPAPLPVVPVAQPEAPAPKIAKVAPAEPAAPAPPKIAKVAKIAKIAIIAAPEPEPEPEPTPELRTDETPVADYIDELLAAELSNEPAMIMSVMDPFIDTSYTPLYYSSDL